MKIALLTDIHANLQALLAVTAHVDAWRPDLVVVGGDIVNRGPRPRECLAFVQERMSRDGWEWVRGNHEDYVLTHASPDAPRRGPAFEVHKLSYWTYKQLGADVSVLKEMPFQYSLLDDRGREVRFTHGSMLGLRDGIYPWMSDAEMAPKLGLNGSQPASEPHSGSSQAGLVPLAVFAVGHTHLPLVRRLGQTLVVNAGSAGMPFDKDTRPSYARLEENETGWQAEIVRVDYDLQAAIQDFYTTGYLENAGPLCRPVLVELKEARSMLYNWTVQYQHLVLNGEMTMEESVRRYLGI